MLKIEEVLQLKEQGYTAEEIINLAPIIAEQKAPVKAPTAAGPDNSAEIKALNDKIAELESKLQAKAIAESTITAKASADDVMKALLTGRKEG